MKKLLFIVILFSIFIGCQSKEKMKQQEIKIESLEIEIKDLKNKIEELNRRIIVLTEPINSSIEDIEQELEKKEIENAVKRIGNLKISYGNINDSEIKNKISNIEEKIQKMKETQIREKNLVPKMTVIENYIGRDYCFKVIIENFEFLPSPEIVFKKINEIKKNKKLAVIDFFNKDDIFLEKFVYQDGKYQIKENGLYFEINEKDYIKKLKKENSIITKENNTPLKYSILKMENNGTPGINLWIRITRQDKDKELQELANKIIVKENLRNKKIRNIANNNVYYPQEFVFFFYLPNQIKEGSAYKRLIVN